MTKPLLVIANAESGSFTTGVDTVKELLAKYDVAHTFVTVRSFGEAHKAVADASHEQYQAVAVFGGDGTVLQVVKSSLATKLPVLVLPGGSANMLAQQLDMPGSLDDIIKAYAERTYLIRRVQLAEVAGELLMLDAHFGLLAESLKDTPQELKGIFGKWAYGLTMMRKVIASTPETYELEIDGTTRTMKGYICYIINHAQPEFLGEAIAPPVREGMLSVAVVRETNMRRLLIWYFLKKLRGRRHYGVIYAQRADTVVVKRAPKQLYIDDETRDVSLPLTFTASDASARFIVPVSSQRSLRNLWRIAQTTYYRFTDHARRELGFGPSLNYTRVAKHLYLGGQYRQRAVAQFRRWQVSGIVSMREFIPKKIAGIEILHLPTVDHTPPSIANLEKGVHFIDERIKRGESVYIHCRLGEGRGPSMAAAYLISTGMRAQDAIAHLQRTRPFVRPNKRQVEQLMKFAEKYQDL